MPTLGKLRRIFRLPPQKLVLLLEAAFWLVAARLAIRLLPFARIGQYLGPLRPPSTGTVESWHVREASLARQVAQAVNATAINSPVEMVCLPRALAAWQMLHLRGVAARLHFGTPLVSAPGTTKRSTHAWLSSAGVEVTGYPVAHSCIEIGYFAREARPAMAADCGSEPGG